MSTMHKYPGLNRTKTDAERVQFNMRLTPAFVRMVDEWRRRQSDIPNRSEAIRRMVTETALRHNKRDTE